MRTKEKIIFVRTSESEFALLAAGYGGDENERLTVETGLVLWSSTVCVCTCVFYPFFPQSSITITDVTAPLALERPI